MRDPARDGSTLVPSDLEQMPHLLNFLKNNGVLLSNHHTPLIAHTSDDIITIDLAAGVQCPLHGKRFTPRFHLFVAAWLWENEVKFRWPRLSAQYHKAWAASFPPDL
jgi:hypothetical protein